MVSAVDGEGEGGGTIAAGERSRGGGRVPLTGGNRSGSGLGRYQTGPNSKFKFEFKKIKNS